MKYFVYLLEYENVVCVGFLNTRALKPRVKANNDFGFTMNNVLAQVINLIKTLFKIIIHDKHSNKLYTETFSGHHVEHI